MVRQPRPILMLGVPRSGTTWIEHVFGAGPGVCIVHEPDNETERPWPLIAKSGLGRFPRLQPGERAPRYEALWREALTGGPHSLRAKWAHKQQQKHFSLEVAEAACDAQRRLPLAAHTLALLARPGVSSSGSEHVLVKSVHSVLSADWLAERFQPAFMVVRRDPVEVVASWRGMAARTDAHGEHLEYSGRLERILSAVALRHLVELYGPPPSATRERVTWLAGALMSEVEAFIARQPDVEVVD